MKNKTYKIILNEIQLGHLLWALGRLKGYTQNTCYANEIQEMFNILKPIVNHMNKDTHKQWYDNKPLVRFTKKSEMEKEMEKEIAILEKKIAKEKDILQLEGEIQTRHLKTQKLTFGEIYNIDKRNNKKLNKHLINIDDLRKTND